MPRNGPAAARTDMQAPAESSIPTPKCPTCDVKMHLGVLLPREDGGGEWRFSCPVCKTCGVVITGP
jgi:hypothetical protein